MQFISLGLGLSPPEKRSNAILTTSPGNTPATWQNLFGGHGTEAGETVTTQTSMGQATVNACVRLLSETIASLSPILYLKQGSGRVEASSNPLSRILAVEPSTDQTAFTLWDSFMSSVLLTGNGYIEIQRNSSGDVLGLWFLQPYSVTPMRRPDGLIEYRVTQGLGPGESRILPATSVIHVPWRSLDGVTGISVITEARLVIGGAIATDKFGARFFANNATPSGVLSSSSKVKPEDKTKMRDDWEHLVSGHNQHRTAVLDQDLKYTPISMSNADSQWIETQKFSREQICGLFKLHPSMIGDVSRVAGETYAGQMLSYFVLSLRPWLNRIEQELTRKLLPGLPQYSITHDVSDLLRLDVKSQAELLKSAVSAGLMTVNEARAELGLNPGPAECDQFVMQVNMTSLARVINPPTPTTITGVEDV